MCCGETPQPRSEFVIVNGGEGGGFLVFGDAAFEEVGFLFDVHHFGQPGEGVVLCTIDQQAKERAREMLALFEQVAAQGSFQQMLQGRTYALLQVRVDGTLNATPEISANKYMLWIRFTTQDRDLKPRTVERDIPFELALCAF